MSRFLILYDSQEDDSEMIGFCMFRFENEEGECVIYWFVCPVYHNAGLLIQPN